MKKLIMMLLSRLFPVRRMLKAHEIWIVAHIKKAK